MGGLLWETQKGAGCPRLADASEGQHGAFVVRFCGLSTLMALDEEYASN